MPTVNAPYGRVNAVVASSATLQDYFPRTFAFDLGLEGRPYAVVGRRTADGRAADPDLIVISGDGVLHRFEAKEGTPDGWVEERYDVPQLKGATIIKINASAQDPKTGSERLIVTVSALTANPRRQVFLILERTPRSGWRPFNLPFSPIPTKDLSLAVASGFVGIGGGKLQTFYACLPPGRGISLAGYGVTNAGEAFTLALMDNPQGIDRLVATSTDYTLCLSRLQNNVLTLYPASINPRDLRDNLLPVHFNMNDRSRSFRMPIRVDAVDASCMTPITDTRGLCHGMFVRTADHQLIACAFGDEQRADNMAVLTGHRDGPDEAHDVTSAFGDDGALHVFVRDGNDLIWYANWATGAHASSLVWAPTGWTGRDIEAPQIERGRPYVFVDNGGDRIDQITQSDSLDEWTRSSVTIPEPVPEAEPADVHIITLSTVTAQSDPVPNAEVMVRASRPTVAEYQGRLYRLGPDRPVTFVTAATGGVTFRLKASGIDTANLLVSAADLPDVPEISFRPQESALSRLAGLDADFLVDGARLKAAGLAPASMSDGDANKLADVLRSSALKALSDGTGAPGNTHIRRMVANSSAPAPVSVRFSRADDGSVSVAQSVPAAGGVARSLSATTTVYNTPGGFWSYLRSMWTKVRDFVVEVVDSGVKFIVTTAEGAVELFTRVGRYIAEGVEAVVAWVCSLAKDLYEAGKRFCGWLAEKVGWADVIRCKNLVRDYSLATLIDLETLVGQALPAKISEGVAWAKGQVNTVFDQAIGQFDGKGATPVGKVEADPTGKRIQSNNSRVLLVQNAVPETAGEFKLFEISPALAEKINTLAARTEEIGRRNEWQALLKPLSDMFQGKTSLADGLSIASGQLLRVLKPVVLFALDLVDVIQTLVLEMVAAIIGLFRKALQASVATLGGPFAWVNSLYRGLSGGADLSIIDLASLFLVAPAVILHHIYKKKPVIDPAMVLPAKLTSPLAIIPGLLLSEVDANSQDSVKTEVTATYRVMTLIYDICVAVWAVIRSAVSLIENALRITDLDNVATSGKLRGAFTWIVRIADFGPWLWLSITEGLIGGLGAWIWGKMKEHPAATQIIALVIVVTIILVFASGLVSTIAGWYGGLAANPLVWLSSGLTSFSGMAVVGLNLLLVGLWLAGGKEGKSEDAVKRFWLARGAAIPLQLRKLTAFLLPIGWALSKSPEPVSKGIGVGMIAGGFAIDSVGYLTGGSILAYRASVPV